MIEILIPYVLGSLAVGAVIGWVAKALADDTTVYDTAGNVFDAELVPDPHTDLIVNTMSPLGFFAVQLRLSGDYANDLPKSPCLDGLCCVQSYRSAALQPKPRP